MHDAEILEGIPEPFRKFGTGCCITCGYLTKKIVAVSPNHVEVETESLEANAGVRASGDFTVDSGSTPNVVRVGAPACFKWAAKPSLAQESGFTGQDGAKTKLDTKLVFRAITKDRACKAWWVWHPGELPEDHAREQRMMEVEERRRQYEEEVEASRRVFEKGQQRVSLAALLVAAASLLVSVTATLVQIFTDHGVTVIIR